MKLIHHRLLKYLASVAFILTCGYSAILIYIESTTSQEFVRHFFTDITGPVPFYAINTTLSVSLLWATALLFAVCLICEEVSPGPSQRRWFFLSQIFVFFMLGMDDRFKFHEALAEKISIGDHFVLIGIAILEIVFLSILGGRSILRHRAGWFLGSAAFLFAVMLVFDACVPHDMLLRLTVEDLAKTWANVCFFAFAWTICTQRIEEIHRNSQLLTQQTATSNLRHQCSKQEKSQSATFESKPVKVLILGDVSRTVLPILRSLGRNKIECHVAWCSDEEPALRSRYLCQHFQIPWYSQDDVTWVDALNSLMETQRYDLVLPATEAAVFALQTHRNLLVRPENIYLLEDSTFQTVFDKLNTYRLAESLGVNVPKTHLIDSDQPLETLTEQFSFPLIVKPRCSVHDIGGKHFVRTARTQQELSTHVEQLIDDGSQILLQEHFEGIGVGIEILADQGQVLTAFQHRRLHETNGFGSTYRESVEIDTKMYNDVRKIVEATGYSGIAMFEFRLNPVTGDSVLLEINGRFWGSLPLAIKSGADFPLFLVQLLLTGRRDFLHSYPIGVRCRSLVNDLYWCRSWLRNYRKKSKTKSDGSTGWLINDVTPVQFLKDAGSGLLMLDYVDSFAWDDTAPFIYEMRRTLEGIMTNLFRPKMPTSIPEQKQQENETVADRELVQTNS